MTATDPGPSSGPNNEPRGAVIKADAAAPEPLYPVARLVRGATLEADETLARARQVLAKAEAICRSRPSVSRSSSARR